MGKYYFGVVSNYDDKRYEDIIEYQLPPKDCYLKNVVESYRTEKAFLWLKALAEYFVSFPIIMEETEENCLTDLITGEDFFKQSDSEYYKGISELLFQKGMEIDSSTVTYNLKRLSIDDIQRYHTNMKELKKIFSIITQEKNQISTEDAEEYIEEFKTRKYKIK